MVDTGHRYTARETSLREFYNVLFRQKRRMIGFFVSLMMAMSLLVLLAPRVYRSEAEVLVRIGRENASLGPTVATGKIVNINVDRENEINSEVDILRSRELAEKVVDEIGAKPILAGAKQSLPAGAPLPAAVRYWTWRALACPVRLLARLLPTTSDSTPYARQMQKELAVLSFMKRLDVEASKKSNIITISYKTNAPYLARKVLNRFVAFYLEKHIEVNRTPGSYNFFKKQKDQLLSSLERTEKALKNLKNKTSVASIADQRRLLLERIEAMRSELGNTQSSTAASLGRIKALRATLARLPAVVRKDTTSGFANSAADEMRKQVDLLELQEQKLLSTFTEASIPVQEIRRRIEQGKALLLKARQQDQVTTGINENYQKLQLDLLAKKADLSSLGARAGALRAQLIRALVKLHALNDTEMRFEQLDRDLATQNSNYLKYSESLEQARIDEALDMQRISNISIVEAATYSVKPVWPKPLLMLAVGLFLALSGAFCLAFFCEFQDHSIRRPEDVENRLHLPLLATLPLVSPENHADDRASPGKIPIPADPGCELLLLTNGHRAALGDLLRLYTHGTCQAVALSGCHGAEGVSTACALIALRLAQSGEGRILLIDANFANPGQHSRFDTKLCPGLAEMEANANPYSACTRSPISANLDILSAGNCGGELTADMLKAFSQALPALRRGYGAIVCDLPPLLEHDRAKLIASMMDGVVLVIEAEKTRREVAEKVGQALLQADVKVLGAVLNKRRFHIPRWLYKTL